MQIKLVHSKQDPVRVSFPKLFKAESYQNGDGPKSYGVKLIITKGGENDKKIRAAIKSTATDVFGAKADIIIEKHKTNNMKCCYTDGDLGSRDEYQGFMVLGANRPEGQGRPKILDKKKRIILAPGQEPTEQQVKDQSFVLFDGKPYSGCYLNAVIDIYCQKGDREGIRATLGAVQFADDGDSFSGATSVSNDDFDEVSDGADALDSLE